MAGLAPSILGGAASLGGAIYGAISSAKNNKKARALIQKQRDDNRAWYNTRMAEDYTQRSDAQAVLTKQRELLQEQYKQGKASNIVSGGTDEGLALQKEAANNAMAQTMSGIAANAASYKDSVENQYRAQDNALNQQQVQTYGQQAQQASQAGSQLAAKGLNLMGASFDAMEQSKVDKAATEPQQPSLPVSYDGRPDPAKKYNA